MKHTDASIVTDTYKGLRTRVVRRRKNCTHPRVCSYRAGICAWSEDEEILYYFDILSTASYYYITIHHQSIELFRVHGLASKGKNQGAN